jgi:hypothetical protein
MRPKFQPVGTRDKIVGKVKEHEKLRVCLLTVEFFSGKMTCLTGRLISRDRYLLIMSKKYNDEIKYTRF